jgi:uncharacterized membrane protein
VETTSVPNLGVSLAGGLVLLSLLLFVVFLDGYLHRLRPVAVAALGTGYVRQEFKRLVVALEEPDVFAGPFDPEDENPALVVRSATAGAIQAVDVAGLVGWARRHRCLLVLQHRVGDFVPTHEELIRVYGGEFRTTRHEQELRGMVALGGERTLEQDPAFAIRVIVDVAAKALSAAINDPTTAVQVLNQLSEVLWIIGTTELEGVRLPTGDGQTRGLVIPMRSWDEYLALGVTEIRQYGSSSIQVVRRLRALLEQLQREVPSKHRAAVDAELARLDATVADAFGQSVDLDRARIADEEGMGGRIEPACHRVATH